jgi:hypothetical protein
MKQLTQTISILFHPIFMPLIGIFILINAGLMETSFPQEYQKSLYLIFALFSILLPVSFLPLLYYWRIIKSFEITDRRERFIPLIFTSASLVFLNIMLNRIFQVKIINAYTFSIAAASILILFMNFILKISLHTTGLGGITGLVLLLAFNYHVNMFVILLITVLVSGVVSSVRLYIKAHSQLEIYSGYFLGLCSTYGFMYLLLN